eukprot:TCONS_00029150-protein
MARYDDSAYNGKRSLRSILQIESSDTIAIQYYDTNESESKNITYNEFIRISNAIQKELSTLVKPCISDGDSRICLGISSQPTPHLPILVYSIIQTGNLVLRPVFITTDTFEGLIMEFLRTRTKYLILTHQELLLLPTLTNTQLIESKHQIISCPDCWLVTFQSSLEYYPNEVAYIIETSGTTRQAKENGTKARGELIHATGQSIIPNILDLRALFSLQSRDVILLTSAITFDASLLLMFLSWHSHCTLLVMSRDVVYKPTSLVQCLEKVTVLQCTPSFLQMVGSKPLKERIFSAQSALRILALGGEMFLTKSTFNRYLQHAPSNLRVFNIFGISELSSWASIYEVNIKRLANAPNHPCEGVSCDWLPIGEALSETRLGVWNDDNEAIVPPREGVGNLVVGSDTRLCYIEDDGGDGEYDMKYCQEKTQEMRFTGDLAFITANGQIYLCGRKDDKIKRMGQFVSLATLNKMVEDIPFVEQCCTVYHDRSLITFVKLAEDNGDNTLVDSINDRHISNGDTVIATSKTREIEKVGNKAEQRVNSPLSNKNVTLEADIKRFVRSKLPSSYLPDVIQLVDIIPINKNGKSDSKVLIRDYLNRKKGNSTENSSIRSSLEDIYCLALNLGSNVLEKNDTTFAELGGDSFAALYVVNTLVYQYFQTEIDGNLYEEIFNKILTLNYRDFYEYFEQLTDSFTLVELMNGDEIGTLNDNSPTSNSVIPESRKEISNRKNGESLQHQLSVTEKNQFYAITSQNKVFCSDTLVESEIQIPSSKTITPDPTNLTNFPIKDKHNPCINLKVKRKHNLGKCIDASPLVVYSHVLDEPLVLIGCHSKRFVALTTEGVLKWELETNGRIESSATLTADGRFCVFGCHDGFIYFVDIKSGENYWKYKTNDIVKSSPVSYNTTSTNGYEYCVTSIACHDKFLYSLDHINKKVLWKVPTNSLCCSSPLVNPTENTLYVTLLSVAPKLKSYSDAWTTSCIA